MPGRRQLPTLWTRWPSFTAKLKAWKDFMERCDSWSWGPGFDVDDGEGGRTVNLKLPPSSVSAVSTSTITAKPNADTLGQGTARLRLRAGAALSDGPEVRVYSNFSEAVPSGSQLEVAPDGADFKLVAVQCPDA